MISDVKGRKCNQCTRGTAPGDVPTFAPWCPGCQAKLHSDPPLRTGNEPPPQRYRIGLKKRMAKAAFDALVARRKAERAAEWAATLARPRGRAA